MVQRAGLLRAAGEDVLIELFDRAQLYRLERRMSSPRNGREPNPSSSSTARTNQLGEVLTDNDRYAASGLDR